jgi:hypothetical protein
MNKKNYIVISVVIWLILVGSLVGVRYLLPKRAVPSVFNSEAIAIYQHLDDTDKKRINHYESAIIRLSDGRFHIVGDNYESEEKVLLLNKKLTIRRIDFRVEDPVLLERRLMVGEAYITLNNAEKHCYADGFASIVFRDGAYSIIVDSKKYPEYVLKYGTECKTCEELKKEKLKK